MNAGRDEARSRQWLNAFADRNNVPPVDDIIALARCEANGVGDGGLDNDGEYIWCGEMAVDCKLPSEFWDHLSAIVGSHIPVERRAKQFVSG